MKLESVLPDTTAGTVATPEDLIMAIENRHRFHHSNLGALLLEQGLINRKQLNTALAMQEQSPGKKLGELLVDMGAVTVHQANLAVARSLGAPAVQLEGFELDPKVLAEVPASLARRHRILPLMLHDERLVVAMENLMDTDAINAVGFAAQRPVETVYASHEEIQTAISRYYDVQEQERELDRLELSDFYYEDDQEMWKEAERLANETPIVKLVNSIILDAIHQRASDIHLRPGNRQVDLLYRVDGTLIQKREIQKRLLPAIVSRIKIIARLNIAEHRVPQDGRSRMQDGKNIVDLRISIIPCQFGESIVIRILNKGEGLRSIHEIGFTPEDEAHFEALINKSYGMLLVTGPTGSGKTTTLYAALREVSRRHLNIVTVEDPVEYEFEGMRQISVLPAIHFGFPQALRHILRHDPDVIMIGEIRDQDTCKIAVESALTGHLVLSTLHTNDAPSAVTRLMEMGVEPYLIKSAVIGVLAQRLVRRNCPHCLVEEDVDPLVRTALGVGMDERFRKGAGCEHCNHTGFHGRMAVYELLTINERLRSNIVPGMASSDFRGLALQEGMVPLSVSAVAQARLGVVSLEEVYRVSMEVV